MPTTLPTFAANKVTWYTAAQANAQAALLGAQGALTTANNQLATDLATRQANQALIATNRASLATATAPADIAALNTLITAETIQDRQYQKSILDDQTAVAAAQANADFWQSRLTEATANLAAATAYQTQVTADNARRQGWVNAIANPPLATLVGTPAQPNPTTGTPGDAYNVLNNLAGWTVLGNAAVKFTTAPYAVPPQLMTIAQQRYNLWQARAQAAQTAVDAASADIATLVAADDGKPGTVQQTANNFAIAQRNFGDFAMNATARFNKAVSALQAIANLGTGVFVLTAAEAAAAAAAGVATPGAAAEALEATYDTAQSAVDVAALQILKDTIAAQYPDPNASIAGTLPAADTTALTTAQAALTAAGTAITPAATPPAVTPPAPNNPALENWQITISDTAWQMILSYIDAQAVLTTLQNTNLAPASAPTPGLAAVMGTTEGLYGDALNAAWVSSRGIEYLNNVVSMQQEILTAFQASLNTRLFSAVRGDAN